jgi:hypothetical protein
MSLTPLESDGRAAASKAERAGSIPARGTASSPHRWPLLALNPPQRLTRPGPRYSAWPGASGRVGTSNDELRPDHRWTGCAAGPAMRPDRLSACDSSCKTLPAKWRWSRADLA